MGVTTKFSVQKRVPTPFFNVYTFTHVTNHMDKGLSSHTKNLDIISFFLSVSVIILPL